MGYMMSLRVVHSGTGYEYLLRSVATNDGPTDEPSLSKYYAAKGTPPGRWIGRGLSGFNDANIHVGAEISEENMAALYGEGFHPDADNLMRDGAKVKDIQLGRPFANYTNDIPVLVALRDAERKYRQREKTLLTREQRSDMAQEIGTEFFIEEFGREPESGREVVNWVNGLKDEVRQSVAGFDLTFSPAKSISVLWALADEDTSRRIEELHHRAVAEALEWTEDNALFTRSGKAGAEQVKTKGLIASEFKHYDTRAGDPDLHSHVLVSNKVQAEDGRWLSIDGYTLMKFNQTISHRYNSILTTLLTNDLDVEFSPRQRDSGKEPTWEIDGISEELLDTFSKRRAHALPVYERLVEEHIAQRQASPSVQEMNQLWQKAILETRDAKREPESLYELREAWRKEVLALSDGANHLAAIADAHGENTENTRPLFDVDAHSDAVMRDALEALQRRRSYFRKSHISTAVAQKLQAYRFESVTERNIIHDSMTELIVEEQAIALNDFEMLDLPERLKTQRGFSRDNFADSQIFTTQEILDTEAKALAALDEPVAEFADSAAIDSAVDAHEKQAGFRLNSGQEAMARYLLNCGTLAATGVGPAGTGKTASLRLVADVWAQKGNKVIGLAPSAQAADVLSQDLGTQALTVDKLTFTWRGNHPNKDGYSVKDLPVEINPGDMILVDEAGMVSTPNIGSLIEIAEDAGAVVRFVGDHKQLGAVENGGLFGAMVKENERADNQLSEVIRFGGDSEQSAVSLRLREGDTSTFDFYNQRGWVHGGGRSAMLESAVSDYLSDIEHGHNSLLIAATNKDVVALNTMIRSHRIACGEVNDEETITIARGESAGLGDTILTRQNRVFSDQNTGATTRVTNGELLTLADIRDDGSIIATDDKGHIKHLPADYVRENVQLGYAATVYRAQGTTVDVTRAVIDQSVDRAGMYVALTRGKLANHVYAVTEHILDPDAEDGHYHYIGNANAPGARDVFNYVVSKDTNPRAAHDIVREVIDEQTSPERITRLWNLGRDDAITDFIDAYLPDWIDTLPAHQIQQLEESDEGTKPIRHAWTKMIDAGIDPRAAMQHATVDTDNAEDIARLIRYRLDLEFDRLDTGQRNQLPPITSRTDMELDEWLRRNNPHAVQHAQLSTMAFTQPEHNDNADLDTYEDAADTVDTNATENQEQAEFDDPEVYREQEQQYLALADKSQQRHDEKQHDAADASTALDDVEDDDYELHPGAQASMDFLAGLERGEPDDSYEDDDYELHPEAQASMDFLNGLGLGEGTSNISHSDDEEDDQEEDPSQPLDEEQEDDNGYEL